MATNVLPAFEASLARGVSALELERAVGWRRAELEREGAQVSGASTYEHMELMHQRADYPDFMLDAARRYSLSCLGVVGLACKTSATVADALVRHSRYQALTNRSAAYSAIVRDGCLIITEERAEQRLGSALISEYTMFVALHLLRSATAQAPRVLRMATRRAALPAHELARYVEELGAPLERGAPHAQLVCDAAILTTPLRAADPELERYFQGVLERAMPDAEEHATLRSARQAIQRALPQGEATLERIASELGVGARTLQRRLSARGYTFGALLDATRRQLAHAYLRDPTRTLIEVAYLLGYSEQASFTRAFRRWEATTPTAWRAGARG